MQFVVRDVARLFQVPEKMVHRWIDPSIVPAHRIITKYDTEQA